MNLERRRLFKVTLVLHIDLRILLKVKTAVCQWQAEGLCNLRTTEDTNIDGGGGWGGGKETISCLRLDQLGDLIVRTWSYD